MRPMLLWLGWLRLLGCLAEQRIVVKLRLEVGDQIEMRIGNHICRAIQAITTQEDAIFEKIKVKDS